MTDPDTREDQGVAGRPVAPGPSPSAPSHWKAIVAVLIVGIAMLAVGVFFADPIKRLFGEARHVVGAEQEKPAGKKGKTTSMPGMPGMEMTGPAQTDKFAGQVAINPAVAQNIGVRVQRAVAGRLSRTLRTVGVVAYNETQVRDVNLKVSGWVQKLYVSAVGDPVEAGQTLFDLYSPDLYAAQEEYLSAWKARRALSPTAAPEVVRMTQDMLDAGLMRLRYYDITKEQIAALEASGKLTKTMAIASPCRGLVIDKHAVEGMHVDPGMRLYTIADLSTVWIMVTLYEYQLPFVQVGQQATVTLPYVTGRPLQGKITYIYPYLNEKTRETKARLELENPGLLLKPGMFANVALTSTLAQSQTLVPREAVLATGERQVAFVSLGQGKFEPRQVKMGQEGDNDQVAILEGLKPGELVVTSAQFLIDSESRLQEAMATMMQAPQAKPAAAASMEGMEGMGEAAHPSPPAPGKPDQAPAPKAAPAMKMPMPPAKGTPMKMGD